MKKRLFCIPLWGIIALSLSSCRSEDTIVQQAQKGEVSKKFEVFTPKKSGEFIDYAKGFAYLTQRYDKLKKTNLSGINNKHIIGNLNASTEKIASTFKSNDPYIEFNVPSETIIGKNGEKWIAFPKVKDNKVIGFLITMLVKDGTYVKYNTYGEQDEWYKQNVSIFQEALDQYLQKSKGLKLSASINPIASGDIPGVTIQGRPKPRPNNPRPDWSPEQEPMEGGGSCDAHEDCAAPEPGGGNPTTENSEMPPPPERPVTDLKKYLECLDSRQPANIKVFANTTGLIGHAFISIQQGFNIRTFGFYPENSFPQNVDGPGIMGDNSEDHYDAMIDMGTVSAEQLQHIIRKTTEYNDRAYSLYYSNCANFAMDVMQIIKPSVKESTWEKPGTIEDQIVKNGGVKQSGKGPATHVNCN